MADNVNDSLKNLNNNIKDADANLAKLSKDFNVVFTEAVNRAARDAKVSIDQMFDAITGRVGASKGSKLKLLFDIVDEHGKTATPQTIQQKIDRIVNATPNARGTKLHIGMDWVDVDTANANLRRYKEQLKLIQDMPAAYDLVMRAVNAIQSEFDKEAAAKQRIIDKNEKILAQEIAIEEKQRSKAAAQQQKQENKQYKEAEALERQRIAEAKFNQQQLERGEREAAKARANASRSAFERQRKDYEEQRKNFTELAHIQNEINKIANNRKVRERGGIVISKEEAEAEQRRLERLRRDALSVGAEIRRISDKSGFGAARAAASDTWGLRRYLNEKEALRYSEALSRIERQSKQTRKSLESMLPTLSRLASAFGVAFSVQGLVQFGKKLVETRGEFELQQVALRSILQNKQLADEIWDKTMQAALQSPFTAMQLTRYTKQLAAYRIETDKLFDTTKRLADVSAGLGVDMQRLILAYGQVKAANYLRASEIRQFTEAGVNILGELSDYFARTRGEMVSTAQVMEMVQKRMVKFEDVEAIFKHMTDEGGIFYNMQYIQSQTVRGQINKLHDAYDQMLNSIGQGNQGVLKNMVSIANNLVRNWREVAGTIQGIAWAFVFVQLGKIAIGIHRIGTEAITAGSKVSWLARQLGKLREKSKGYEFGKVFSKANVVLAAGAAVAFVTGKFIQHLNAVRQLNEKYNELSLRAYETQENLSGIQKTLSQNNQSIERLNKVSGKSKEQEEELANARKQNAEIVNKLKRDYPELADGMNIQKNGVVTLTSAISDYNEQLEYTILLNQLAKGNTWNDDFQTNVTEMTQSLQSAEQTLASYQSLAKSILLQMRNMDFGFREKSQAKGLKELLEGIIGLEKGDYEGLNKLLSGNRLSGYNRFTQTRSWRTAFQPILLDEHNIKATKKQLERSESVLYDLLKVSIRRDKEYMTEISKEWGGDIDKFIHNNAERIQKNVDDGKKDTFKAIREYGLQMGFAFKGAQDVFNQTLNRGNTSLFGGLGFRFFEYPGVGETSTDTETAEEKQAKIDAAWRRRIQLLEEMRKRYEELSKSAYGYAKSNITVRKEFEKSWGKTFGGVLSMNAVQFTSAAEMEAAFETILAKAGAASDAVKEEIQKKADSYGARIPIDVQVRIREDFGRQMEEAFGNYELTLDLQKLNLPSDVLEDMFGMESVTLDQIRQKIGDWYESMRKDGYSLISETDYKEVEKYLKKVDDLERKQQRERIKDYAKYLEYEMSERAKISMDYTRKIAEVQAETAFKPEQRERIIKGLQKEMGEKLAQQDWEDFKGTEVYVQMMEDLEKHGTEALVTMRQELEKVRENAENLSPRALKEVVNAIEKIKEIELDRSTPFVNVAEARKEFQSAMKDAGVTSAKELFKQADALEKQRVELSRQKTELENIVGAQREYYDATKKLDKINEQSWAREYLNAEDTDEAILADYETAIANRKANDEELKNLAIQRASADEAGTKVIDEQVQSINTETNAINIQIERLKEWMRLRGIVYGIDPSLLKNGNAESDLTNVTTQLETTEKEQEKANKAVNAYDRLGKAIKKTIDYVKNLANTVNPLFDNIMENLDYLGGETNTLTAGWKEFGDTMVSAITDIASAMELIQKVQEEMAKEGLATSLMSGNLVAAAVAVLGVLIKIVSAIGRLHDARLDRIIEKVQERIDALKDAYARLEKQIEKTWGTVEYIQTYEQQVQNLYEQISAMEAQMNAERAKKNTDENAVLQYQRDIQDAYDQLDELEQKSIEVFGGIGEEGYRSAAEGFVEAWKSAFLETGDGLQGLQDHFDEFLQDWFVKQATMRIAGGMLEPVFRQIDSAVDKYGEGGTSAMLSEIERVREMAAAIFPDLSLAMEDLAGMFGVGGEDSLSGLAAGIQGMTEEQANILEAYWNSVRMYTASIDMNVSRIAEMLGVGGANTNPLLQQMTLVAANTQATHQLLQSVVKSGHSQGGYGIKVFND